MSRLADFYEEFSFLDERDERTSLLIDLGKQLEPMDEVLKSEATLVKGCQAKVWVYPTVNRDHSLHFHADSTSGLTKGIIALILLAVQDRTAEQILTTNIDAELAPFDVGKHLTSVRTSGLRSMIEKIRETATRYV